MQSGRWITRALVSWPLRLRALVLLGLVAAAAASSLDARQTVQSRQNRRDAWLTDEEIAHLPPALRDAIERDAFTFFRRVNRVWNERVCAAFAADRLPKVRLHGDAHVEQYAFMQDSYGLDDFDDSAEGPAVIDVVRFIGSLRLVTLQRGWRSQIERPIDAFLDGYRRAIVNPSYMPAEPRVVRRLRSKLAPTPSAFLASTEALMEPAPEAVISVARESLASVAARYPGRPAGYFTLKKMGALQMGVGSYTAAKFLIRVEGPSPAADDDVILEAKEVSDLDGVGCITTPPPTHEAVRVIIGTQQIGRLHHSILTVFPGLVAERANRRDWWLRSWDRTYHEVQIKDLQSSGELDELARDAGAQLGSTSISSELSATNGPVRQRLLDSFDRLRPRVRRVAADLTREMLAAWRGRNGKG